MRWADGRLEISGTCGFTVEVAGQRVEAAYELKMLLGEDFPKSVPVVWETEGTINRKFEHLMSDDSLCLGAEVEILRRWRERPHLLSFVSDAVVPYLAAHAYWQEHGSFPLGALKHGPDGVLQYYGEYFGVSPTGAVWLVKLLAEGYVAMQRCPCGTGKRVRDCHWTALESLRVVKSREFFGANLRTILANRGKRTRDILAPRRTVR